MSTLLPGVLRRTPALSRKYPGACQDPVYPCISSTVRPSGDTRRSQIRPKRRQNSQIRVFPPTQSTSVHPLIYKLRGYTGSIEKHPGRGCGTDFPPRAPSGCVDIAPAAPWDLTRGGPAAEGVLVHFVNFSAGFAAGGVVNYQHRCQTPCHTARVAANPENPVR